MSEAYLTSKGQATIPLEIRRSMKLKPRDRIVFNRLSNGTILI